MEEIAVLVKWIIAKNVNAKIETQVNAEFMYVQLYTVQMTKVWGEKCQTSVLQPK